MGLAMVTLYYAVKWIRPEAKVIGAPTSAGTARM
jgi:hypothetical protein